MKIGFISLNGYMSSNIYLGDVWYHTVGPARLYDTTKCEIKAG